LKNTSLDPNDREYSIKESWIFYEDDFGAQEEADD
jgi:hypothetical protein